MNKWLKRFGIAAGVFLLSVVILAAALFVLFRTEPGRNRLAAYISSAVGSETFRLDLEGLKGRLPWNIQLDAFTLSDADGIWLSGRNLNMDVSLKPLLQRRIAVNRLILSDLTFYRPPQGAGDGNTGFSLDRLRLPPLSVNELSIGRIAVDESFLSPPRSFSLSGSYASDGPVGQAALRIVGIEDSGDSLDVSASLNSSVAPALLTVRAELTESSGGLAGKLAGMPEADPLNVSLNGQGPLNDWTADLAVSAGRLASIKSSFHLSMNAPVALTGQARIYAGVDSLPEQAARFTGRQFDWKFGVGLQDGNVLAVRECRVVSDKAVLSFSGEVALSRQHIDGDYSLQVLDTSAITEASEIRFAGQPQVDGHVSGPWTSPDLSLRTTLQDVSAPWFSLPVFRLSADLSALEGSGFRNLSGQGNVHLTDLKIHGATELPPEMTVSFDLTMEDMGRLVARTIHIQTETADVVLNGNLTLDGLDLEARTDFTINDLKRFPPFGPAGLGGRTSAEALIQGGLSPLRLDVDLKGRLDQLSGLPQSAGDLVGSQAGFSGRFTLQPDMIQVAAFQLQGKAVLDASGKVDLAAGSVDAQWGVSLADPAVLVPAGDYQPTGPLKATGGITGPFTDFSLTAEARLKGVRFGAQSAEKITARIQVSGLPDAIHGSVDLRAFSAGQQLMAGGQVALKGKEVRLNSLKIELAGARVTGDLSADMASWLLKGKVKARSDDLRPVGDFLGLALKGSVDLDVRLSPDQSRQAAEFTGEINGLETAGLRIGRLNLTGRMPDLMNYSSGRATLQLTTATYQSFSIKSAELSLDGRNGQAEIRAESRGTAVKPFRLKALAVLSREEDQTIVRLQEMDGRFDNIPLQLEETATLVWGPDRWDLDPFSVSVSSGKISGKGSMTRDQASLSFDVEKLPLALVNLFSPMSVKGTLDAALAVSGSPEQPHVRGGITVNRFRPALTDVADVPPMDVALNIDVQNGLLEADMSVAGLTDEPGQANLAFPLQISLRPLLVDAPSSGRLTGQLQYTANLSILPLLLSLDAQTITGLAAVNVWLSGTLGEPNLSGEIALSDGKYENPEMGVVLHNITAKITAQGTELKLSEARAQDGVGGEVAVVGAMSLDPRKSYPYQAEVTLTNTELIRLDLFTAQTSGTLRIFGDIASAELTGDITVNQAVLNIPDALPPSLVELEVEHINTGEEEDTPPSHEKAASFHLGLDVSIDLPGRFYVRGRGLDSEWKGRLNAGGSVDQPAIRGELTVVRGRFTFLDRTLQISEGSIYFDGSAPPSPLMNVSAETTIEDITTTVTLYGSPESPELTLSSSPYLPEDEILAQLLFGRSLSAISPLQALQLAQAARKLAGSGGGLDVMGAARNILGVDAIDIHQEEKGGAAVGVGKYLADNVYVEAQTGIAAGAGGKVVLEIELTPHFSVESEIGSDAQSGVMFNWKLDY